MTGLGGRRRKAVEGRFRRMWSGLGRHAIVLIANHAFFLKG